MRILYKFLAFLKRDWQEATSFKAAFFFDMVSITGQVIIALYLGRFIDPYLNTGEIPFGSFLLIGVALAGYQATALQSFSLALHREIGNGTLEAVLMTPTSPLTLIAATAFWNFFLTTGRIFCYLAVGIFIMKLPVERINFPACFLGIFLTLTSLSGVGLISAAYTIVFKRGDPIAFLINGFTRILSGVYFPLTVLPAWLGELGNVLPLTSSLKVLRGAVLEEKNFFQLSESLGLLLLFTITLLPLGLFLFHRAVASAKRDGSLSFPD